MPVALPGPVGPAELLDEYRRADALAMPCRLLPNDRDGIPNVLVEAMAAGAPVVATNVSGIPELIEHEVNGLLVPPDDPDALADALMRLHEDRALVARLTAAGRETVHARFDGERLAQELADLFEDARRRPWRCSQRNEPTARLAVIVMTAVRPRPVFCVNEHEHRDRALAREVAAGRFTFAGETRALGLEPDWLHADLPADEEWRIDWVKFYYGLDLADAFRSTGDRRFLDAWERLVASFIVQVAAGPRRLRGHRAPDPQLDLRVAAAARGDDRRRGPREPARAGPPRAREPVSPSATTARSSSTRC